MIILSKAYSAAFSIFYLKIIYRSVKYPSSLYL